MTKLSCKALALAGTLLRRLRADERGQDMIEYALLGGMMASIGVIAIQPVYEQVANVLNQIPEIVESVANL